MPTEPAEAPETELVPVPADQLLSVARAVGPLLEPALAREGDLRVIDVFRKILAQEWQLWAVQKDGEIVCALVTALAIRPMAKVLQLRYVGGDNIDACLEHLPTVEAWARQLGAVRVEVVGRKGWKRKLAGYQQTDVILRKVLADV